MSISDEGPGLSAENQSRLFEGFHRIRFDKLQQREGSGLGLFLCKQIVTIHGGTIGVDSVEGQIGRTFHFTIPFGIAKDVQSVVEKKETLFLEPASQRSSSLLFESTISAHCPSVMGSGVNDSAAVWPPDFSPRILVVDDVASNRKMLKALLRRNGATEVDMAENGLEAVEAALGNSQKYDMIFMDNLMPVMNGVQAVRRLREGGYGNLVVGVTGNVLEHDVA
eukprot:gene34559-biopygen22487